nr:MULTISPECIES: citrate synthase family protein [Chelativorans]
MFKKWPVDDIVKIDTYNQHEKAVTQRLVSSERAAAILGVSRQTLYAYVSRGQIRAEVDPADPRRQLYDARELEAIAARKALGRKPREAAANALDWGLPVLNSALSHISNDTLFYRGIDAIEFSRHATLESTARLLWGCGSTDPFALPFTHAMLQPPHELSLVAKCQFILALHASDLPTIWRRDQRNLWPSAASIVRMLEWAGAGCPIAELPVHEALARHWDRVEAADLFRRALVLVADHELNASTFAARVVASTGGSLAAAVTGGLAALSGPRHGGQIPMVEALFEQARQAGNLRAFIDAKLRLGERLPGFGHPLYLVADPRANELLHWLPEDRFRMELSDVVFELSGHRPNIDFALVGLRHTLGLPQDTALFLFLLGRSVGWIAHALEQHSDGRVIRPRASYVGQRSETIPR